MPIQNLDYYVANLWNWGILDGTLGRCTVSDLDGIVERRGQFLVLEAKRYGQEVKRGQAILFDQLVSTGRFTVVVVWGDTNEPYEIQVWGQGPAKRANLDDLRALVREWYARADRQG